MQLEVRRSNGINTVIEVPGDKSITHRSIMLASLSDGTCLIENILEGEDCKATAKCFKDMGVEIEYAPKTSPNNKTSYLITGRGMRNLKEPKDPLYVGNSGTSIRLILGILAGQHFQALITGDESIKRRPMMRVVSPLRLMGAQIHGRENGNFAPIEIKGGKLNPIHYELPVASAQIKSSIMLAALFADGTTTIKEPAQSRDHTERMFSHFGLRLTKEDGLISVVGSSNI